MCPAGDKESQWLAFCQRWALVWNAGGGRLSRSFHVWNTRDKILQVAEYWRVAGCGLCPFYGYILDSLFHLLCLKWAAAPWHTRASKSKTTQYNSSFQFRSTKTQHFPVLDTSSRVHLPMPCFTACESINEWMPTGYLFPDPQENKIFAYKAYIKLRPAPNNKVLQSHVQNVWNSEGALVATPRC